MDRFQSSSSGHTGGPSEPVERPLAVNHQLEMARDAISQGVFRLSLMGKMNPKTALELIAIFQGATRLFNVDCSFGILDAIRTALTVSPVETMADAAILPEVDLQPWMWANQLCDETACYSRVVFDGGSLAMYHNQRMEENFMKTTELYRRVRQLRLLPLFHWTTIVHPTDIPIFYEAMGPIMVGHGTARQTDVIVKCRKKCGAYVPCLVTFRCARGPTEGKGGIVVRIWPLETRIFRTPPPGEPRGQPCVIEPVDLGPIHPPTACNPPPPLPTFSSFPASSSLPPVPPPMAHAPLVAAPLPSMPPPPVFAGPSMPRASITRPPMACPPVAPPPPMLPRPQLMVPFPPPPNTHTHPSHTYSQSYTHPYAFHPAPDVQSWAPPLDLLPVPQLLPPQAVPPRVDMPSDELQTLWEMFGGTGACPRPDEAGSPISLSAPAAKFRRTDNGSSGGAL